MRHRNCANPITRLWFTDNGEENARAANAN